MTLFFHVEPFPNAAEARSQTESVAASRCKGLDDVSNIGCTIGGYGRAGDFMPDILGEP